MKKSDKGTPMYKSILYIPLLFAGLASLFAADGDAKQPNIVVIFGDDIGQTNLSVYSKGLMGWPSFYGFLWGAKLYSWKSCLYHRAKCFSYRFK